MDERAQGRVERGSGAVKTCSTVAASTATTDDDERGRDRDEPGDRQDRSERESEVAAVAALAHELKHGIRERGAETDDGGGHVKREGDAVPGYAPCSCVHAVMMPR